MFKVYFIVHQQLEDMDSPNDDDDIVKELVRSMDVITWQVWRLEVILTMILYPKVVYNTSRRDLEVK
jgi:hypothetical protein